MIAPAGGDVTTTPTDPDDPSATYSPAVINLVHRIQTVTAATGFAPRMSINREPSWDGFPLLRPL